MWLETMVLIEAAASFWLSVLNLMLLWRAIAGARRAARRAAVTVLMCVCGGQAMEALAFLWLGQASADGWTAVSMLLVRTALLVSTALISVLLVRALSLRR